MRAPTAPDVPTTVEVGMPELMIENWYGMIAPAGTPPEIIAALNKVTVSALADAGVKEKLRAGPDHRRRQPGAVPRLHRHETAKWAKVIKDAGIQTTK